MKIFYSIVIIWAASVFFSNVNAQKHIYEIRTLKDKFYGDSLWLKKDSICLSNIKNEKCFASHEVINLYNSKFDQKLLLSSQRYYNTYNIVNPTAYMQPTGTYLIRNFFIFDNSLSYGVNNHINVQFGNTIYSANNIDGPLTPFLALKAGTHLWKNRIHIAAKMAFQRSSEYDETYSNDGGYEQNNMILTYSGILTLGSPDNNVNVAYTLENYKYENNVKMLSIGAKCRISNGLSSLMESYIFNGQFSALTFGFRSDFKKGSICYGFIITNEENYFDFDGIPFPYFGFILAL